VGVLLSLTIVGLIPVLIVLLCAGAFNFAWMIVGSVSLWRDGLNCQDLNPEIWKMGMATVITQLIMFVFTWFQARYSSEQ
jgi:flagellar biosynthesis protein FliP